MSANLEGGPRGSSSSGRSLGVAIAACLSAIVLASLLAVTIFTGDSGDAKADKRPDRVKVDTKPAKDDEKVGGDHDRNRDVQPAQPTPQPQEPIGPIDPFDPYGDTYVDPYGEYPADEWLVPSDTYDIDPWSYDTELDEMYGAAA